MKKTSYLVAALLLACSAPTLTSCFVGSFSCLNKMWAWNTNLTGNKYVNAILSYVLSPFEMLIGGLLDPLVFNTIEFWTGSNPLAATQMIQGENGMLYAVAPDANGGYIVTCQQTGQQMQYLFDQETRTWSAAFEGMEVKLLSMVDEQNAVAYVDGQALAVTLDEQGIEAFEMACDDALVAMK